MNEAYNNIVLAKQHLNNNDLPNAVKYAKLAFVASETAFFDPSLLALLYFPDDQKYDLLVVFPERINCKAYFDHFQIRHLHSPIFAGAAANHIVQS